MARPKIVKKIKTRNHFVHVGDLLVTDYAQVGGDLTVDGNLTLKAHCSAWGGSRSTAHWSPSR